MKNVKLITFLTLVFGISTMTFGQSISLPHLEKKGDVTQFILDGKLLFLTGALFVLYYCLK